MGNVFRNDLDAARSRADALTEENEDLRREVVRLRDAQRGAPFVQPPDASTKAVQDDDPKLASLTERTLERLDRLAEQRLDEPQPQQTTRARWTIWARKWIFDGILHTVVEGSMMPGESLDLMVALPASTDPRSDDDGLIRGGRIPACCLQPLRERMWSRSLASVVLWFYSFLLLVVVPVSGVIEGRHGAISECLLFVLFGGSVAGVSIVLTRRWVHLRRDVREQRLKVEDGYMSDKWTVVKTDDTGQQCARTCRVCIGGRIHDVDSLVFGRLGTAIRYRRYLSAHAGQLVAIESIDEPDVLGAYRGNPRRKQRGDVA